MVCPLNHTTLGSKQLYGGVKAFGVHLRYVVSARVAMVTEPAEEGLVDAVRRLPGVAVHRQVLPTVPEDGVGERHWGS